MKTVFISHSSNDAVLAKNLCDIFESRGVYCWIAPRDIPYGENWAGEIVSAIEGSKVMIFIFTPSSNKSEQVLNEINLALQNGVTVIPLQLSDEKYNRPLRYLLSLRQWIQVKNPDSNEEIELLAERVKLFLNGKTNEFPSNASGGFFDGIDVDINLDDELEAKFAELFPKDNEAEAQTEAEPVSPLRKRLLDRIRKNYLEKLFIVDEKDEEDDSSEGAQDGSGKGLYFEASQQEGETLVFIVRKRISCPSYEVEFVSEELERVSDDSEDGENTVNYFIDYVDKEGNPLVLVTFPREKNVALVNMGFIYDREIRISKNPMLMEFKSLFSGNDPTPKKYRAKESGRIIFIDPETCTVVHRQKHFDRQTNKWDYYYEVVPNKKYFAFAMNTNKPEPIVADAFTVGYGYYKGRYGLTQNVLEAVEWFDRADTEEAYRCLCEIFRDDPLLSDKEDFEYYAQKLSEAGENSEK
ncbi:MAG: toll/interleukin-1 receptor domain-containing protein [Clostridia bacterium]|nr:toll/interleukin-1 receptor domain-containing protein [Clostridia bacterium]